MFGTKTETEKQAEKQAKEDQVSDARYDQYREDVAQAEAEKIKTDAIRKSCNRDEKLMMSDERCKPFLEERNQKIKKDCESNEVKMRTDKNCAPWRSSTKGKLAEAGLFPEEKGVDIKAVRVPPVRPFRPQDMPKVSVKSSHPLRTASAGFRM